MSHDFSLLSIVRTTGEAWTREPIWGRLGAGLEVGLVGNTAGRPSDHLGVPLEGGGWDDGGRLVGQPRQ